MRFTEHKETPVSRATSVFRWPALNKISTSCRLSMPNILLPPPSPGSQTRGRYRESSTSYAFCWMAQNFRNAESQNFRNLHRELMTSRAKALPHDPGGAPRKFKTAEEKQMVRDEIRSLRGPGTRLTDLYARIAARHHVSPSTIKRIWNENPKD